MGIGGGYRTERRVERSLARLTFVFEAALWSNESFNRRMYTPLLDSVIAITGNNKKEFDRYNSFVPVVEDARLEVPWFSRTFWPVSGPCYSGHLLLRNLYPAREVSEFVDSETITTMEPKSSST